MKILAKLLFTVPLALMLLKTAKSQNERRGILDNFSIAAHEGIVYLNWLIGAGNFCDGTDVYRSTDSLNFEYLGGISGICGHSTEPSYYRFADKSPLTNQKLFYRLEMGNYGFSKTLHIEIKELTSDNYQLRPNPAKDFIKIYFSNQKSETHQIFVYSSSGTQLIDNKTNSEVFHLDLINLASGFYFFHIKNSFSTEAIIGKFIIK